MPPRIIRALGFLAVSALAGCGGLASSAPTDTGGDFRSAPLSVTPVACLPRDVADAHPYELAWAHDEHRLTVDLYGVDGVGCAGLEGGAVVDDLANTLYLFFEPKRCDDSCGDQRSQVRLVMSDDLHGLINDANVVVTLAGRDTNGRLRPDLSNYIVSDAQFSTRSDDVQYIPAVQEASVAASSPGKSVLSVRWTEATCQRYDDALRFRPSVLVPYATRSFPPRLCTSVPAGEYTFDSSPSDDAAPVLVLSKAADGKFSFIEATR